MNTTSLIALGVVVFIGLAALGITYDVLVWNECRADNHTWFYCLRMISE